MVGPNGSGKTTLLNMLAFLRAPSRGRVVFRGETVDYSDPAALLSLRRTVGYLMQNPYIFNMSVSENISYGLKVRGRPRDEIRRRAAAIMESLSLSHLAHRITHHLSGGEAQRVALARTLDCDVVLLDEPTANVDRRSIRAVESAVLQLNRERQTTIVLTTHSQDQAYRMSRKRLAIINGRICGVAYENVFEGVVCEGDDGVKQLCVAEGVSFVMAAGRSGERVTVAIDPEDVILSESRLSSSALNAFRGTITRAEASGDSVRVFLDVGVSLAAVLTRKSFETMGLNIGRSVWATFKASALKLV